MDRRKRSGTEVDRRHGSKADGGVGLRLIGSLGRLVGRRASVATRLTMSQVGGGKQRCEILRE